MRITLTIGSGTEAETGGTGIADLLGNDGKLTDRIMKAGLLLAVEGLRQLWNLAQTLLASAFG